MAKVAVATPVALVGTVIHIVPYEVVRRIARIPDNDGMRATVKLLGCLAGFTTVYSLIARAVGKRFGRPMGAVAFAVGPASGYVTVHFFERLQQIGGVVEATRLARERRTTLASLRSSRAAVVEAAAELLSVPSSPSEDRTRCPDTGDDDRVAQRTAGMAPLAPVARRWCSTSRKARHGLCSA